MIYIALFSIWLLGIMSGVLIERIRMALYLRKCTKAIDEMSAKLKGVRNDSLQQDN